MIIVKMNSSTVECSIAASELREIGLTPEAVVNGEQDSVPFLAQINREVGEQLAYNPENEVLMMSKNLLTDGSVHIFAMKMGNEDIQQAADRIRAAAQGVLELTAQDKIDEMKAMNGAEKGQRLNSLLVALTQLINRAYMHQEADEAEQKMLTKPISDYGRYLIALDSLEACVRFGRVAAGFPVEDSALYKKDDRYYLVVGLRTSEDGVIYEFRKTCVEYAELLTANSAEESHITETGDCLMKTDALAHLAALRR